MTMRKTATGIFVTIKSADGVEKSGVVDNDWIFWYLSAMRENREIELLVKDNTFSSNGFDPDNRVGPDQVCYGECPRFTSRLTRTYLDNPANFYFARTDISK